MSGLILIATLGVSLYLSPLRSNTVAVVGVFASLTAIIIAFLATTEIEVVTVEEEKIGIGKTSEDNYGCGATSDTAMFFNFSYVNMCLGRTNEFKTNIYSSDNQVTLSSHYGPRRAYLVKRQLKETQTKRLA